jgi:ATP-dependent DNA helicase RecG
VKREPVESSNIQSVGYDATLRVLEIEFHGGAVYQYDDVDSSVYADLMAADSKGQFFSREIRKQYQYERIA